MGDAYYLKPPREQTFYQYLGSFTTFICIGKQTWWGFDPPTYKILFFIQNCMVYFGAPTVFLTQVVYMVKNWSTLSFNARGALFSMAPVTALVDVIVISAHQDSFKRVMKDFLSKIHLCNVPQDEYIMKERVKAEKLTRFVTYFMCVFILMDWQAWCIIPAINNYLSREEILNKTMKYESIIYMVLPIDYEYKFKYWLAVHIVDAYLVWCGCVIITVHNVTNYAFVFQMIGHIEILKYRVQTEFKGTFTEEELRQKLISLIKYHAFILNSFIDIQNAFGLNVTGYYLYNLIADSLNLYQLMLGEKRNAMVHALMFFCYVGVLVIMSFVLEEVRRKSDDLCEFVYDINWEDMPVANQKMVLLFLMRIQPPLIFTAAGGFKAGVRPMISILKTSFSIYVMLKSSIGEN